MHGDGLRYFECCRGKYGQRSSHSTFPRSAHKRLELEYCGSFAKSHQNFWWFRFHKPKYSWNDWWKSLGNGLFKSKTRNTFRHWETIDADFDVGQYANENIEYNVTERQKERRTFSNGCRYHQWKWVKLGCWDGSHKNARQAELRYEDFISYFARKFEPFESCRRWYQRILLEDDWSDKEKRSWDGL